MLLARLREAAIRGGLETISLIPPGLRRGSWSGRGIVFTLHHVRPEQQNSFQPNALLSITPEFLDQAIRVAFECGLMPARLEDIPSLLAKDDGQRFFAVTLDDGYRDNAVFAAPVFRRHGVPYTIFVTSGFSERSRTPWWELTERLLQQTDGLHFDFGDGAESYMTATIADKTALFARLARFVNESDEDAAVARIEAAAQAQGIDPLALVKSLVMDASELRDLVAHDALASLGAHSLTHCNLKRVNAARLKDEIRGSIAFVEAIAGNRPKAFAYPYGWVSAAGEREAQAVAESGISVAVTTRPGVIKAASNSNMHLLPRVSLNGLYQRPRYVSALISGLPFLFL